MNYLVKSEEIALFFLCVFLFSLLNLPWWWFIALLLAPDLGMIGYVFGPKTGAFTYNLLHHRLVASVVALYALTSGNVYWQLAAVILFAHISLDRALGYGLKFSDSFTNTHLGRIGKEKNS